MDYLKLILKDLYFHSQFYYWVAIVVVMFIIAFFIPFLYIPAHFTLYLLSGLTLWDIYLLFRIKKGLSAQRIVPEKLSNGDTNEIEIKIINPYKFAITVAVIDEIPFEFQYRDFKITASIGSKKNHILTYQLKPNFRGLVSFGNIIVTIQSPIGLAKRRNVIEAAQTSAVYPSFKKMKNFHLNALPTQLYTSGMRKTRKLGHSLEFENIKEYVIGDDFRTVNWKATAKTDQLMVNQYQEEVSQTVYCILDKGRVMKMPFNNLSLLDHAINALLMITYVVIQKRDYAGFFSFSKTIDNSVLPERRSTQMQKIMNSLYNVRTDFFESDYSKLYNWIRQKVTQRSLLILFTNFETHDGLQRQLPYLRAIAKNHLLLVVFFRNTELDHWINQPAENTKTMFDKIAAEKFMYEKKLILRTLRQNGIQTLLTEPENITIDTINKYLELKSRGQAYF